MKLYNKPELVKSIHNNLLAAGIATGPLVYEQLLPYDQHHYHGVEALDLCIRDVGLNANSNILNIGSGLGGPARYFAGKLGAGVLALELQYDLHRTALELTERCSLRQKVHHMCGDILDVGTHLQKGGYDCIVSWLTFLHIPPRKQLLKICFDLLKPGGKLFCEDFFELKPLTGEEKTVLAEEVYCNYVPDMPTYKEDLKTAGFSIIKAEDLTADWREWTAKRVEWFDNNREKLLRIHREDTFNRLRYFYDKVRELYAAGNLGGARFVVQKPNQNLDFYF